MGITGKLGIWFYHFLVNRTQFVRLPGGSSTDSHVISGVPQGTVLGPLLFLILMSDIDEGIVNSKIISFADDTRLCNSVSEVEDCDVLQSDLNSLLYTNGLMQIIWLLTLTNLNMFALPLLSQFLIVMFVCVPK